MIESDEKEVCLTLEGFKNKERLKETAKTGMTKLLEGEFAKQLEEVLTQIPPIQHAIVRASAEKQFAECALPECLKQVAEQLEMKVPEDMSLIDGNKVIIDQKIPAIKVRDDTNTICIPIMVNIPKKVKTKKITKLSEDSEGNPIQIEEGEEESVE